MAKKLFQKGHEAIPGAGRPKGSTDQKWYDLRWWYQLILDNYEKLNEVQKVELGLKGLALIVSKLPSIPATPKESAERIEDAQAILNAYSSTPAISSGSSMEERVPEIQTGTEATNSI
jgi:hypothetical protein